MKLTRNLKYFYRSYDSRRTKFHIVNRFFDEGEEIITYKYYSRRRGWQYESIQWKYFKYSFEIGNWATKPFK